MSAIGSTSSQRRAAPSLREPNLIPISTPEEDEDNKGDITIKDLVNITIIRSAKVNTLPKFRREVGKLKEFITKLQIYYKYNLNSFDLEADKVTYAILYIEGFAFEFVETFLLDFKKKESLCIKETKVI